MSLAAVDAVDTGTETPGAAQAPRRRPRRRRGPEMVEVAVLPVRDRILYPQMVTPLPVGRPGSLKAIEYALAHDQTIFIVTQRDAEQDEVVPTDLYEVGTEAVIGRVLKLPDGNSSVLVQGQRRMRALEFTQVEPMMKVRAIPLEEEAWAAESAGPLMKSVLAVFEKRGIALRVAAVGERFEAGPLTIDVLHPPMEGPGRAEDENPRSMVLLLHCGERTILLTGDLEGQGQAIVRERPIAPVDVMLAPHHGGKSANAALPGPGGAQSPGLMAAWAKPKLVISSQRPGPTSHLAAAYGGVGAVVWDTPTCGAVTVRCHADSMIAEAFRSGEVRVVARGW